MRDFVSDFNSVEGNSESNFVKHNSNYGNSTGISKKKSTSETEFPPALVRKSVVSTYYCRDDNFYQVCVRDSYVWRKCSSKCHKCADSM